VNRGEGIVAIPHTSPLRTLLAMLSFSKTTPCAFSVLYFNIGSLCQQCTQQEKESRLSIA